MASPPQELFAAGAIPAGWTAVVAGIGTVECQGPSGGGQAVISAPNAASANTYLQSGPISGDFDFMVVAQSGDTNGNGGEVRLLVGFILASDAGRYFTLAWLFNAGWWSFVDGNVGGNVSIKDMRRYAAPQDSGYARFRFRRVGATLSHFVWSDGAWLNITVAGGGALWNPTESVADVKLRMGIQYCPAGSGVALVRGVIPLAAGADPAVPSAPSDGKAFSAPSTDDADLGVGASWASAGANVARKYEVQVATDAAFTTIIDRKLYDLLPEGLRATHRTGGLVAGTTYWIRARWWDECGRSSAWSTTLSAAAAITPSIVPSFTYPAGKFRLPVRRFRA